MKKTDAPADFVYPDPMGDRSRLETWVRRLPWGNQLVYWWYVLLRWERWEWLRFQLREMVREIERAARPPVKVRRHGRNALAVSTREGFGGGIVVIPIGTGGVVGVGLVRQGKINGELGGSDTQIIRALSHAIEAAGKRDIWQTHAINFTAAYVPALREIAAADGKQVTTALLMEYLPFEKFWQVMNDPRLSPVSVRQLGLLLEGVPGYKADKAEHQSSTFKEQYSYQQIHLRHALASLERGQDENSHEVEVWASEGGASRKAWSVGRFPDRETAEYAVEIIRKPLTGSEWGKWVFRVACLWVALIFVRTWFGHRASTELGIAPAQAALAGEESAAPGSPTGAALMSLFGGGAAGGGSAKPGMESLVAALGTATGTPPPRSLADQIYSEAMAKANASKHEQGPPQSPVPDADLKGFGLSGSGGAGCDPQMKFKVAE